MYELEIDAALLEVKEFITNKLIKMIKNRKMKKKTNE